jgi:hypothetical protein
MAKKVSLYDKAMMADFKYKDAVKLANKILPFVGKRVYVYGGGGYHGSYATLKSVDIHVPLYYSDIVNGVRTDRTHFPSDNTFHVKVKLTNMEPPFGIKSYWYKAKKGEQEKMREKPIMERSFSPQLGSWRLAMVTGKGKNKKLVEIANPVMIS